MSVHKRLVGAAHRARHRPRDSQGQQHYAFLEHAADDPYAALWRLAATTGMERGELVALRWRDVDFDVPASRSSSSSPRAPGRSPRPRRSPGRPGGHPVHPDRLTQMFRQYCTAHLKVVQARLGHSSIAITLDTYSHVLPGMHEDAASQLAAPIDGHARAREGEQR